MRAGRSLLRHLVEASHSAYMGLQGVQGVMDGLLGASGRDADSEEILPHPQCACLRLLMQHSHWCSGRTQHS